MLEQWYKKRLTPDYYSADLRQVNWHQLVKDGIRCVLLDVDNTLAEHGSRVADEYAKAVINALKQAQCEICVLSNGHSKRIAAYAESLGVRFIGFARKPSPRKVLELLAELAMRPDQCLIVGDQLLTDVLVARRAGCRVLLVDPRFQKEAVNVALKRKLERWLFRRYGNDFLPPPLNTDLADGPVPADKLSERPHTK